MDGTRSYEVKNVVYDQAVDVFSYAMVLFEIITGDIPWQKAKDADEVFDNVEVGGVHHLKPTRMYPVDTTMKTLGIKTQANDQVLYKLFAY